MCDGNCAIEMRCPLDLMFDNENQRCEWILSHLRLSPFLKSGTLNRNVDSNNKATPGLRNGLVSLNTTASIENKNGKSNSATTVRQQESSTTSTRADTSNIKRSSDDEEEESEDEEIIEEESMNEEITEAGDRRPPNATATMHHA